MCPTQICVRLLGTQKTIQFLQSSTSANLLSSIMISRSISNCSSAVFGECPTFGPITIQS